MREDRRLAPSHLRSADVHAELQRHLLLTELIQHILTGVIHENADVFLQGHRHPGHTGSPCASTSYSRGLLVQNS